MGTRCLGSAASLEHSLARVGESFLSDSGSNRRQLFRSLDNHTRLEHFSSSKGSGKPRCRFYFDFQFGSSFFGWVRKKSDSRIGRRP